MNSQHEQQVEQYLDRLNAQLTRLPPEKQDEVRQETRAHLMAMIEAKTSTGSTLAEAVDAALRQFGDPVKIGQQIASECRRDIVQERQTKWLVRLCAAPIMFWSFAGLIVFFFGKVQFPGVGEAEPELELKLWTIFTSIYSVIFLISWRAFMLRRWACAAYFAVCWHVTYNILATWYYHQYLPEVPPDPNYGRIGIQTAAIMVVTAILTPTIALRWRRLRRGVWVRNPAQ